ncbi:MAG: hypothetical protein ACE5Z5_05985 [Candidatus Bathyarchaeia archaeon]
MSEEGVAGGAEERPFWVRPPWTVLFDIVRLHRVRPWDVNISYLLNTLMGEMRRRGHIDFTASGVALLSSSTIYRMKSELILKLEEPPQPPPERPVEFLPPPVQLPYRYPYTIMTFESLMKALEEALKAEDRLEAKPRLIPVTPAPPMVQEIDQFMVNIEENIGTMYGRIAQFAEEEETIPLSRITAGQGRIDAIRSFILVLFLANRGEIRLWQEEEFGEIYISLNEGGESVGG